MTEDGFEGLRPLLLEIAYRILDSWKEAEDAVHKTWLRWEALPARPASAKAFLSAEVMRISTDALRSARAQQIQNAESFPSDPIPDDLCQVLEQPDELIDPSAAILLMLDQLSPFERAVFVLREMFRCSFPQIASAVGRPEAVCRQLAAVISRAGEGDRAFSWPQYIIGAENVARVLAATIPPLVRIGITLEQHRVNGRPGLIFRDRNGKVLNAMALSFLDGQIQTIHLAVHTELFPT